MRAYVPRSGLLSVKLDRALLLYDMTAMGNHMNEDSAHERRSKIRCLMTKAGLDGHDRGAHIISRSFRDVGFEVVYSRTASLT
ncbi:MAG: hypothetical protein J07HQX50_00570 [Haloquadratum sp. J07HQX50]|nr:MAG: hypothetical protein J07HQX50_00570 [Haloquadratum sp. J07HQX50]